MTMQPVAAGHGLAAGHALLGIARAHDDQVGDHLPAALGHVGADPEAGTLMAGALASIKPQIVAVGDRPACRPADGTIG